MRRQEKKRNGNLRRHQNAHNLGSEHSEKLLIVGLRGEPRNNKRLTTSGSISHVSRPSLDGWERTFFTYKVTSWQMMFFFFGVRATEVFLPFGGGSCQWWYMIGPAIFIIELFRFRFARINDQIDGIFWKKCQKDKEWRAWGKSVYTAPYVAWAWSADVGWPR